MQLFTDHAGVTQGKGGVGGGGRKGWLLVTKQAFAPFLNVGVSLLHHIPRQHEFVHNSLRQRLDA